MIQSVYINKDNIDLVDKELNKHIKNENISEINLIIENPHPKIYHFLKKINHKKINVIDLPFEVKLEVTPKCNLTCSFCYNDNAFSRENPELNTDAIKNTIDKIAKYRIAIRFSGGEPLMREDIFDLLKYAKDKGLYVMLNTNSTLIKPSNIKKFKGIVDQILIPFHSVDKKDVARKYKIVKKLREQEIYVSLNTVLTKENIANIETFYKYSKAIDAYWFLARPVPSIFNKEPIDSKDVKSIIEKLIKLNLQNNIRIDGIPFCAYDPEKVKLFSLGSTSCGIFNKIVIDPTGKVKPCYSINEDLGNIKDIDLQESWKNKFFEDIRNLTTFPDDCKTCPYLNSCLGGCRFAAKLINKDYSSMDPLANLDNIFPFISIVIPVHNKSRKLSSVIDSLLKQKYNNKRYEILIVNSILDKDNKKIIEKYNEKHNLIKHVIYEKNELNINEMIKHGSKYAKGKVIIHNDEKIIKDSLFLQKQRISIKESIHHNLNV